MINIISICFYICFLQGGKSAENSRKKIFIGGLPISITEEELKEQFTAFGHVRIVRLY